MKRHFIRWLKPSTEDLKALLVERLPSTDNIIKLSPNALSVTHAVLQLHDAYRATHYIPVGS